MTAKPDKQLIATNLPQNEELPMTSDAILRDFSHYFGRMLGRRIVSSIVQAW